MSDRSEFVGYFREVDLDAVCKAFGVMPGDLDVLGGVVKMYDEQARGGGDGYVEDAVAAGIPFVAIGTGHYAYNGFHAVFDGRNFVQVDVADSGLPMTEVTWEKPWTTPDFQRLVKRFATVLKRTLSILGLPPAVEPNLHKLPNVFDVDLVRVQPRKPLAPLKKRRKRAK